MKSWNRYPALYYGFAVIAGISLYHLFWPPLLLGLLGGKQIRTIGFYLILATSYINTSIHTNPPLTAPRIVGTGYYQCKRIRNGVTFGKPRLNYQGVLACFITEEKTYRNLPCYITVDSHKTRPRGDRDYIVEGKVSEIGHGLYKMHVDRWIVVDKSFNLSEIRFYLKERLRNYLKTHIKNKISYAFFASLGTGEIENKLISMQFARAGLNHTLAISGFHYTYLIIAMTGFLGMFFYKKTVCFFLIGFISLYFLFIGETPSLNRAWTASLIFLLGYLFGQKTIGLNSLGLALLTSLTLDPNAFQNIGFQMSYLATFAILTLYPSLNDLLEKIMPKRSIKTLQEMPYLDKHGYILSTLIRQAFAITIPVNLVCIPINLYYFKYFPFMSLFFNLFFPFGITVSLVGLMVAVALPYGGWIVLFLVEKYSKVLLNMVFYGMGKLESGIEIDEMGLWTLGGWIMGAIFLGLFIDEWRYRLTLKRMAI